jgi:hypothetical protein
MFIIDRPNRITILFLVAVVVLGLAALIVSPAAAQESPKFDPFKVGSKLAVCDIAEDVFDMTDYSAEDEELFVSWQADGETERSITPLEGVVFDRHVSEFVRLTGGFVFFADNGFLSGQTKGDDLQVEFHELGTVLNIETDPYDGSFEIGYAKIAIDGDGIMTIALFQITMTDCLVTVESGDFPAFSDALSAAAAEAKLEWQQEEFRTNVRVENRKNTNFTVVSGQIYTATIPGLNQVVFIEQEEDAVGTYWCYRIEDPQSETGFSEDCRPLVITQMDENDLVILVGDAIYRTGTPQFEQVFETDEDEGGE